MAAERGPGGRFRKVAPTDGETLVSRETPGTVDDLNGHGPAPVGILPLRLVVDDVTPSIERTGAPPPVLPPEAQDGPTVDDVPLYVAATRGLDWGIGAALGDDYRATPDHLETVAEAAAPIARRLADLIGAAEAVDATVPPIVRELVTLAAAVYVAWGDALEVAAREAIDHYRHRGEDTDDASAEDRPARGSDPRAGGRDRGARRAPSPSGRVAGANEDPEADGVRPPGPSEGRGAELAAGFAAGRALGSGAG